MNPLTSQHQKSTSPAPKLRASILPPSGLVATNTASGYATTNCEFTVDCLTSGEFGHEGPFLYTYTPSSATAAAMTQFSPSFTTCTQADFSDYTSGAGPANTLFVIDSVKYTIREGEVF